LAEIASDSLSLIDSGSVCATGQRLEVLVGQRSGQWSIRINDQWRICFHFVEGHALNVEIVDYH